MNAVTSEQLEAVVKESEDAFFEAAADHIRTLRAWIEMLDASTDFDRAIAYKRQRLRLLETLLRQLGVSAER
ncbi:MAG TPA: hypothetical protein VKC34_08930 [Blastocatellia bacterium]|nr:hypothetical protein [Blastocatellia bacterium]